MDTPLLWHIPLSHYNEKVRWALDYKGIAHRRRVLGPDYLIRAWRATGQGKLPILWLDGRAIADSTRIIAALEERYPEPPLYPRDAAARQRALALEDDLDETLGPAVRAAIVTPLFRNDPDIALRVLTTGMPEKAYRTLTAAAPDFSVVLPVPPQDQRGQPGEGSRRRRSGARPHRAGAARPRVSRRRGFHRRRPHGCRAAGAAPAAARDPVPAAGRPAALLCRLPRHAAAASSRAVGGRHLPPASRTLRGSHRDGGVEAAACV